MIPSEIRKKAREALSGNWANGVFIVLAFIIVVLVFLLLALYVQTSTPLTFALSLVLIIISAPLTFGLSINFLKLKRGEYTPIFNFLKEGFSRFGRAWGIYLNIFIRLLVPLFCLALLCVLLAAILVINSFKAIPLYLIIISAVVEIAVVVYLFSRALLYELSYYISYDNPTLTGKECVLKSAKLMKGNRGNLFLLALSFIGWFIISLLTLGIGFVFVIPYFKVSCVCLYESISKTSPKKLDGDTKIEE